MLKFQGLEIQGNEKENRIGKLIKRTDSAQMVSREKDQPAGWSFVISFKLICWDKTAQRLFRDSWQTPFSSLLL